jgi:hypothetical protein
MTLHTCRRPLPRWEMSIAGRLRWTLWPSPSVRQLGSQSLVLTGPLPGFHASLRPVCSLAPPSGVLSVSFTLARVTQAMRLRPLTASGLSPYGFMDSSRHHVGSGAGAVDAGGLASPDCFSPFGRVSRSSGPSSPFPAPATSNRTGRFPAFGSPRRRHPCGVMSPFGLVRAAALPYASR